MKTIPTMSDTGCLEHRTDFGDPCDWSAELLAEWNNGTTIGHHEADKSISFPSSGCELDDFFWTIYNCDGNMLLLCNTDIIRRLTRMCIEDTVRRCAGREDLFHFPGRGTIKFYSCFMEPVEDTRVVVALHGIVRGDGWKMLLPESYLPEESFLGKTEDR